MHASPALAWRVFFVAVTGGLVVLAGLTAPCLLVVGLWGGAVSEDGDAHGSRTFHIDDFGSKADSGEDAGPAIRRAIAAAIDADGPATVRLGEGTYLIGPPADADAAVPIKAAHGLTFKGAGCCTRLVFTDPKVGGIRFEDCQAVRIADLTIDYAPLPFTQGTVRQVDGETGAFILEIDEGFLLPNDPAFELADTHWGLVVKLPAEGADREQYGPVTIDVETWKRKAEGTWRAEAADADTMVHGGIRPGARFVLPARGHTGAAVTVWRSRQVELDNVTIHASPSLATLWGLTEDITIRGLRIKRPEQSGRLLSTNADGIHSLGNRGRLLIEDCVFKGMADDAINIHARAGVPVEQPAPDVLLIDPADTVSYREGDQVQVYDPQRGRIRYESIVKAVDPDNGRLRVAFDKPMEGIVTGETFRKSDHLFNLNACGSGAVVRHNRFGPHRGRGIVLKSADALIEGNSFRNREGWGVAMHQLQAWGEGPAARRVLIRGNTFEGKKPGRQPFIDIRPSRRGNGPVEGRPVRNVRIESNRMINPANGVLSASGAKEISFVNNVIDAEQNTRTTAGALLRFDNASGVRIDRLRVRDANEDTTALVAMGDRVEAGNAEPTYTPLNIGMLTTDLPEGVPLLKEVDTP
ncbi:MAG: right-handed parallel beta-helix repeat-containing protein [Candidatus Hydrogenedentota bacterium]